MGQPIYGASVWQERGNASNYRYDVLTKDSEVIAIGDPLMLSSNVLAVYAATSTPVVIGVAARAYTAAQTGSPNDTVYCPFVPADDTIFLMGTDSDLTDNETNGGTYYRLTGSTGTIQVAVTAGVQTGVDRIVEIVKVDPRGVGGSGSGSGLREVLVRFVKTPYTNLEVTA